MELFQRRHQRSHELGIGQCAATKENLHSQIYVSIGEVPVCLRESAVFHGGGVDRDDLLRRMADANVFPVSVCGDTVLGVCHRNGLAVEHAGGVFPRFDAPIQRAADGLDVCHAHHLPVGFCQSAGHHYDDYAL